MNTICGIYGYQITRPIELNGIRIEPRTTDYEQAKKWARDLNAYHLTAVVTGEIISSDLIFDLEGVLSFVEHLDVLISSPIERNNENFFDRFSPNISARRRCIGGRSLVVEDTFFPTSRADFVRLAVARLQDRRFCERNQFRALFFKFVESFRHRPQFVEISYYLLFSGLESHARAVLNDRATRQASRPICKLLKSYGFNVEIEYPDDPRRAVATYVYLRNELFHNGSFVRTLDVNGAMVNIKLVDYFSNMSQLVALVVMRAVGFDDGHINWDSWIDQQSFK